MKKLKDLKLFSKFRNADTETRTTYFYGILFIFILIVALIMKVTPNNTQTKCVNEQKENINTVSYEEVLNSIIDNYEEDISINKYYLNEYINIKKDINNQLISIKDINKEEKYYINRDDSYKFINDNYVLYDEQIYKDIDITFTNPENIIKLLENKTYNTGNKYMIDTASWIKIYNEVNNTNIEKIISGEIIIEFISYKDNELTLTIDLSNLYKNLKYDFESVNYSIKFKNINKIDLSNISIKENN